MTERQWQATVEGWLRFYGWRHYHAPDNTPRSHGNGRSGRQRVTPGFPDLIAIRRLTRAPIELAVLELKTDTGRVSLAQDLWLADWAELGRAIGHRSAGPNVELPIIRVGIWRPAESADLELLLAGPRGPGVMVTDDELCTAR